MCPTEHANVFQREHAAALDSQLHRIFEARGDQVIFVRGDRDLEFRRIPEVIDLIKGSGLQRIALMTR